MTEAINRHESLKKYQNEIEVIFRDYNNNLDKVRNIAADVSAVLDKLGSLMQQHTAVVCPECRNVCCINRHSYHAFDDIVYIYAIGGEIPLHKSGLDDSTPCQFLRNSGCAIPRFLRPYRCNWYFCTPLLDHIIEHTPNRHYRLFIKLLQEITVERQRMTKEYASVLKDINFNKH